MRFYESDGKLYFATHVGYYEMIDGMERLPVNAPAGYQLYPGGHILSYNLSDGKFEDLALAPAGEGILTMEMDRGRGQIYCITWPTGYFLHYNIATAELKDLGPVSVNGEAGIPGDDYRVLCRSMFTDSRDGTVYYSTSEGDIYSYNSAIGAVKKVEGVDCALIILESTIPQGRAIWDSTGVRLSGSNQKVLLLVFMEIPDIFSGSTRKPRKLKLLNG